ncbi:MAG: FAD-binding oxidoreductase [Spirochaetaceae bacterium]|nr:MAG: FAD-binding oxidoreductase [Spirochaetaceae bacterium]
MNKVHDVLIVGAGSIGSAVAYHLSAMAVDVGVIEAAHPGAGTTGATVAVVSSTTRDRLSYALFMEKSKDLYCELAEVLDVDFHYERCGMLWIFMSREMLEEGKRVIRQNSAAGLDIHFVDSKEITELEPALSTEAIYGAGYAATDGQLDPFLLVRGLTKRAADQGARFYYHTRALKVEAGAGSVSVRTDDGIFKGQSLVVAAGIWSPFITKSLGIDLPLRPVRGQVLVSQPMPKMFNHVVHPGISQDWRGNIIMGISTEEVGYDNRNTLGVLSAIARSDILKAPAIQDLLVIRSYSGLRPMPSDGYPLIDKLPGLDNVYVAVGHSAIANAQIVARSVAEWIAEGKSSTDLADFSLARDSLSQSPVPYRGV